MWLTGTDEYLWSLVLTNAVALVLNILIVLALAHRIWVTRTVNDRYTMMTRIAKGVLLVSACYQIMLSVMRLTGMNLPLEFRDTWVLKDIGIFTYVLAITLLHRRLRRTWRKSKPTSARSQVGWNVTARCKAA